jgi:hypothetical protein
MVKYILGFFLVCCLFQTHAQINIISISGDYNIPLGKMDWSYKPAFGTQLSYTRMNDINGDWERGMGVSVGYTKFNPIADTLYYVVDRGGVQGVGLGSAVYSPFKIFMLSANLMANRSFTDNFALSMNLAIGYYYGKRDISFRDEFGAEDGLSEFVSRAGIVPRLGIKYSLNDYISITPFVSYTLMLELGSTDQDALDYNENTGKTLSYYSPGLALNFTF